MKKIFFGALFSLFLLTQLSAQTIIENPKDQKLFTSNIQGFLYLIHNEKPTEAAKLLQFAEYLNSESLEIGNMKKALKGEGPLKLDDTFLVKKYINRLLDRAEDIAQASDGSIEKELLLYNVVLFLDPENNDAKGEFTISKESGVETDFDTLLKAAEKPVTTSIQETTEMENQQVEDREISKKRYKAARSSKIRKILKEVTVERFEYSDVTVVDAVNQLTHLLYPYGIQVLIKGNNISYFDTVTASNGAIYFKGPLLPPPGDHTYKYAAKTPIIEIIEHICINFNLKYKIRSGKISFVDAKRKTKTEVPKRSQTWAVRKEAKDRFLKFKKTYEGKTLEFEGYITGVQRNSSKYYFSLDGGTSRLYIKRKYLHPDDYSYLKATAAKLRSNKASKENTEKKAKERERKRGGVLNPTIEAEKHRGIRIRFTARCTGLSRDRMTYTKPEIIIIQNVRRQDKSVLQIDESEDATKEDKDAPKKQSYELR